MFKEKVYKKQLEECCKEFTKLNSLFSHIGPLNVADNLGLLIISMKQLGDRNYRLQELLGELISLALPAANNMENPLLVDRIREIRTELKAMRKKDKQ